MLDYSSADVTVNGLKLHYYRTGGDKPALVLAHGITDDGLCWLSVAEALAAEYDIVMVDARGHGKSDAPADGYTLRNLGSELAALVYALGLQKPVVLGHSMGAITTLVLAGLFPDLPRAIMLEDPPSFWMAHERPARSDDFIAGFSGWMHSLKRKTHQELLDEGHAQSPGWPEADFVPWANSKQRFDTKITGLINPPDLVSIDFPALLGKITCPALFIAADPALGAASSPEDILRIRECMPHLQVETIAQAGHNIRRDRYAEYMQAVRRFLAGLS